MLEHHVTEFIKKWNVGLGFYGEQGGESIHNEFNKLNQRYCMMQPSQRRILAMVKEHHMRIHPKAQQLKPEIKKKKLSLQSIINYNLFKININTRKGVNIIVNLVNNILKLEFL